MFFIFKDMNVTWKEYYYSLGSDLIKKNPTFLSDLSTPCCHFFMWGWRNGGGIVFSSAHVVLVRMQIMSTIVSYVDDVKLRVLSLVTNLSMKEKTKCGHYY